MIYNKYEEQSFGILEYSGKNFIAFSEIKIVMLLVDGCIQ